ncbi:MAG: hypothetical protein JSS36_06895 [Proteobacteria bacterium]|nr:hypothetical protein [Pseudomonadota bacterium]
MRLAAALRAYAAADDPRTAAANRLALVVAGSQPTYPLYLKFLVGGPWLASWWTLLSTPLFVLTPWMARRDSRLGRAQLVVAGVGNTALTLKLFGPQAGLGWFLLPCALIALLAFGPGERRWALALVGLCAAVALGQGAMGAPLACFTPTELSALWRMHFSGSMMLSVIVLASFDRLPRLWRR